MRPVISETHALSLRRRIVCDAGTVTVNRGPLLQLIGTAATHDIDEGQLIIDLFEGVPDGDGS